MEMSLTARAGGEQSEGQSAVGAEQKVKEPWWGCQGAGASLDVQLLHHCCSLRPIRSLPELSSVSGCTTVSALTRAHRWSPSVCQEPGARGAPRGPRRVRKHSLTPAL
ncbi:hypothetical protein SRHO_G00175470 [Serrasalmus rhombeus]